ncbi:MAG: hypothetical protein GY782_00905 [Gammaproteobacteria bacterium]|nr:hypothetical protein [Gammaproteobacteria bacterium]
MREDEIEAALLAEQEESDEVVVSLVMNAAGAQEEMRRRLTLRESWRCAPSPKAQRIFSAGECQLLPAHWRLHLAGLMREGSLTDFELEWILERLEEEMTGSPFETAPDALVATAVFLIQGIEGIATGKLPLSWCQQQEVSSLRH